MPDEEAPTAREGQRKDGLPYKSGNTREDGSYDVGHSRTPVLSRFAKNDGRARGRRAKGTRNLATDWHEELAETVEISEGGKKKRVTKQRGVVKATTAKAMKGSERAAEIVFRYSLAREAETSKLSLSDREIVEQWLAQHGTSVELPPITYDQAPDDATNDPAAPLSD